jgi:ketosteroid isomerase-like protein
VVESRNVALVRDLVDAFNRLDMDAWMQHMDPAVELYEWPAAPGARSYQGSEGLRQAIDTWFDSWEWMEIEILDLLDLDDRVLVTLHQRARGKGSQVEVEIKSFNVYTFRDGKAIRIELFTEREPALEAAGLNPDYQEERR